MVEIKQLDKSWLVQLLPLVQKTAYERRLDANELQHRIWEDPSAPVELLLGAMEDDQLVGYCLACIREGHGVVSLFGTHPERRSQGIARALFSDLEKRLLARGVNQLSVEGYGPGYFWPGVELTRGPAICFLFRQGYETDRKTRVDMEVDLRQAHLDTAATEAKLASVEIVVRRAVEADIAATAAFTLQTFSRGWQTEVEETRRFPLPPLNIAIYGGQVVGFAAYDVTGYARFGPTGTRPDMRQCGIGGVLLKMCLQQMVDRGDITAEIAWAGPISFYAKEAGARISRAYWCFHKNLVANS
ncbi:MAG: GNAT family N-acetyltransferase [Lysobacterales bacterium]|nr:MAG: GNAT family N-acetyltransferase [Xanthomonadales bacterium]